MYYSVYALHIKLCIIIIIICIIGQLTVHAHNVSLCVYEILSPDAQCMYIHVHSVISNHTGSYMYTHQYIYKFYTHVNLTIDNRDSIIYGLTNNDS